MGEPRPLDMCQLTVALPCPENIPSGQNCDDVPSVLIQTLDDSKGGGHDNGTRTDTTKLI